METVFFKFVDENLPEKDRAILQPQQKTAWASGFDLASSLKDDVHLKPFERTLINTGIAISLRPGFEAQIRSRSGLSLNHGVVVLNSPGTIDADYRGEIKVILANLSQDVFVISFGMRIAQLVIAPVIMPELKEVSDLDKSLRGACGFGSTGLSS